MDKRLYQKARIIVPGVIGAAVAVGVVTQNAVVPFVAIVIGIALLYVVKTRAAEVLQDERTLRIGHYAARAAVGVFELVGLVIGLLLMTQRSSEAMWAAGQTLSFSVSGLLVLYVLFYGHYSKRM